MYNNNNELSYFWQYVHLLTLHKTQIQQFIFLHKMIFFYWNEKYQRQFGRKIFTVDTDQITKNKQINISRTITYTKIKRYDKKHICEINFSLHTN